MEQAVTIRAIECSNMDAGDVFNGIIKDAIIYVIDYRCTLDDSIDDMDYPIADDLRDLIKEAGEYILNSYREVLNDRR